MFFFFLSLGFGNPVWKSIRHPPSATKSAGGATRNELFAASSMYKLIRLREYVKNMSEKTGGVSLLRKIWARFRLQKKKVLSELVKPNKRDGKGMVIFFYLHQNANLLVFISIFIYF